MPADRIRCERREEAWYLQLARERDDNSSQTCVRPHQHPSGTQMTVLREGRRSVITCIYMNADE